MKRLFLLSFILLSLAAGIGPAAAQTAEELNRKGREHFDKGFFEATPKKDQARAASEYAQAEQAFREAIKSRPDWVEPYVHLGRTYFVQEKYQPAAEAYRQALKLAPDRKEVYLQLASSLEMSGDYQGAVQALQELRSRESDPRSLKVLDGLIQKLNRRAGKGPAPDQRGGQP